MAYFYRFDIAGKAGPGNFESEAPVVFGQEARAEGATCRVLNDPYVSRQHLRVEGLAADRIAIENLSRRVPIGLTGGEDLPPGGRRDVSLPTRLTLGESRIDVEEAVAPGPDIPSRATLEPPSRGAEAVAVPTLAELGESPGPVELARWFEALVAILQGAAASSEDFSRETSKAVVDLIGLDRGLVLLRREDSWEVIAQYDRDRSAGGPAAFSRSLLDEVLARRCPVFDTRTSSGRPESLAETVAAVAAPFLDPTGARVAGAVYGARLGRGPDGRSFISPLEARMIKVLAAAVGAGRSRQGWQERFEQFAAPSIARALERRADALDFETRVVTVLCCDLRDSSRLACAMGRDYFRLSRDLMERLTGPIVDLGGVIVDFAGDGILAMWNAPQDQPDHAERACRAALAMLSEMPGLNRDWEAAIGGRLAIGIGLQTGSAMVGNAGSRRKVKYGPIGDTVNIASRIEGATKHLGVPILIGDATFEAVRGLFPTRRICRARLSGIIQSISLHELYSGAVDEDWEAQRAGYEVALKRYETGQWSQACQILQQQLSFRGGPESPPDLPMLSLLGKAVECLKTPPIDFNPAWEFNSK